MFAELNLIRAVARQTVHMLRWSAQPYNPYQVYAAGLSTKGGSSLFTLIYSKHITPDSNSMGKVEPSGSRERCDATELHVDARSFLFNDLGRHI